MNNLSWIECDDDQLDAARKERDEQWRDYDANVQPGICQTCGVFDRLDKQVCDYCGGRLATLEELTMTEDEKSIYQGQMYLEIIGYLEDLEHRDVYRGNGHHLAQNLCQMLLPAIERANKVIAADKERK